MKKYKKTIIAISIIIGSTGAVFIYQESNWLMLLGIQLFTWGRDLILKNI